MEKRKACNKNKTSSIIELGAFKFIKNPSGIESIQFESSKETFQ